MANETELTEQQQRESWERGKDALHRIMQHVKIEKIEALAAKVENPKFRNSMQFKIFMQTL
jgi:hypothetical protein